MQNKLKIALYNIDKYCDACYVKDCQRCTLFIAAKTLRKAMEESKSRTVTVTMSGGYEEDIANKIVSVLDKELSK